MPSRLSRRRLPPPTPGSWFDLYLKAKAAVPDALDSLRNDVHALRRDLAPRRGDRSQLLSLREAARRLGIDRGTTLATLLETGQLRGTPVNGRVRIPVSEVERLARDGFDATRSAPRRLSRRARARRTRPS